MDVVSQGSINEFAVSMGANFNNVVYVGWLQDVGTAHWNARFDEATRTKWSWVALRHEIDYLRGIEPGAETLGMAALLLASMLPVLVWQH